MNKIDTTCEHAKIRLIAAAVGFQQCTKTAGTEVQIPGTDKRILIGNDAYLAKVAAPAADFDRLASTAVEQAEPSKFDNPLPPQDFIDYVAKNYSGDVHFADPAWHALKLWNAAMRSAKQAAPASPEQVQAPMVEKVRAAMKRAYCLGQTYWQQADSEYASQHKKADVTAGRFIELTDEICAQLAAPSVAATAVDDELRHAVRQMTSALAAREWAEHVSCDPDIEALESQITELVGKVNAASPASEQVAIPEGMREIGHLIATQDNRYTDQPMFIVQQRRRVIGLDADYCDNIVWVCSEDDYSEASSEEAAQLEAEYQETGKVKSGWMRTGYSDTWEFVTACFTEQGCKDYLKRDGHNLKEPRIYAEGSYRNEEFRTIRNWLRSLAAAPAPPIAAAQVQEDAARIARLEAQLAECSALSQKWAAAAGAADGRAEQARNLALEEAARCVEDFQADRGIVTFNDIAHDIRAMKTAASTEQKGHENE